MNKQVLVIEDNEHSMKMICKLVSKVQQLTIFKAVSSEQAYKYALENNIGLFIVDLILEPDVAGDLSGIRFIEQIREIDRYRFTPIIVTTSLIDQKMMMYSQFHCFRCFEKPYSKTEFVDAVKEACEYREIQIERKIYPYRIDGVIYHIKINDIVFFENKGKYTYIHCKDNSIVKTPYKPCKKILLDLNSKNFIKCSNKNIVNLEFVENIDTISRYITLVNDYGMLEIGPKIKKTFIEGYVEW